MSHSANVRSIPAIRDFRAATQVFLEEALSSLDMIRIELQRAFEWIEHERPGYWQMQQRRAFDLVASTRTALETCLLRTVAGRRPSCIEEQQAHAAAKRRLDECRERLELVKRWSIKLHHEANEFRGRIASLGRTLDQDLPNLLALLERTAAILEQYAEISAAPLDHDPQPSPSTAEDTPATNPTPDPG